MIVLITKLLCLAWFVLGKSKGNYIEDVTIIGAGVGGSYTGWRLRDKGWKIGIYEYSDRVGGRMYSKYFPDAPDLPVDLGAMRIRPEDHVRMIKAGRELGLTFVPFTEGGGRIPERTLLYLRNTRLRTFELGGPRTPYRLRPEELMDPRDLSRLLSETYSNYNGTNPRAEHFNATTIDGVPVYLQSYENVIQKTGISWEARTYIRDSSAFHTGLGNVQSNSRFLKTRQEFEEENTRPTDLPSYVTVPTGMNSFPVEFMRKFLVSNPKSHALKMNSQLMKILRKKKGIYQLKFRKTVSINGSIMPTKNYFFVYSRNVILAIPKVPVLKIQIPQFSNPTFLSALNSVLDVQCSKIFLIYNYPWWLGGSHNFTYTQSDLPYRQSYNWGISRTGKAVLLISYAETDAVPFWSRLQNMGNIVSKRYDDTRVTDEVVKQAHLQLSRVYNRHVNSIPAPIDGMMFIWNKYPYNGGWVVWKPGSRWYDIKRYLTRPFPRENIYINHGYWGADLNGWGESSLEGADDVLSYFDVPSYLKTN
ncbi:achacin-like [Magallana gigas]|uniref:achacin-like n=1 Tax=Magallana gigas TaxID=29159 RepID=UPI0033429893